MSFKKNNTFKLILTVLVLLPFIFQATVSGALVEDNFADSLQAEIGQLVRIKLAPELVETLKDHDRDDYIEVLIILKEQADTTGAASSARKNLPAFASAKQQKMQSRYAVIDALKETAELTQVSLLQLLEDEKRRQRGATDFKGFFIVNLIYARVSPDLVYKIALRPDVEQILPNQEVSLVEPEINGEVAPAGSSSIEWNIERINVPQVWNQLGVYGHGVVVGVIDSGAQWDHEALKEKWRGYNPADPNNPDPLYNWLDTINEEPMPYDDNAHGTHVLGTIVGSGPAGENQIGVAPGSRWIAVKALNSSGYGTAAQVLTAGEFMLAPYNPADPEGTADPTRAPDIINNSWGSAIGLNDWYRLMVQSWRDAGILPVFAVGNRGPGAETTINPGNYPESFAVAATTVNDQLADFSSRGPGPYSGNFKPDVSAPGVNIRSAIPGGAYESGWKGTSMAAPHISGVAALLLSSSPALTVQELEELILASANPLTNASYPVSPNFGFGYGLVDAYHALVFLNEGYGSISGQVLAEENGAEIPLSAHLSVVESRRSVQSDLADGTFTLYHQAAQNMTLRIESDGYYPKQLTFSLNDQETLDLGNLVLEKFTALNIESIVPDRESPQQVGTAVTWTVTAGGGNAPYQFAYYVYQDGLRVHTKWYSSSNTITHSPAKAGIYRVRAFVRDSSGILIWSDSADFLFEGDAQLPLSIDAVIPDLESPQQVGTAVTWTVSAGGGNAPYQYAYYIYHNGTRVYTKWYSSSNTITFSASEAGTYRVRAFVRDNSGILIWSDSADFLFEGEAQQTLSIDAVTPDLDSPQQVGTAVTWTVTAGGGNAPYLYAFYVIKNGTRIDTIWYRNDNSLTYSVDSAGDYIIRAFVRDSDQIIVLKDSEIFVFD